MTLVWTPEAESDLDSILDSIAEDSLEQAERVVNLIESAPLNLLRFA